MNEENQNIEYKQEWKDEYLEWICGFANAEGGRLYIGIDDKGEIVQIKDIKKLSEDIPNKVRDKLGLIVDVNILEKQGKKYIEIIVNKSSFPISCKGRYYYRSGSTKQILQGGALAQFLFDKIGLTWDSVGVEGIKIEDFHQEEFDLFKRQAILSGRMEEKDLKVSNLQLLDSLGLIKDGKLTRASLMLFYYNPEKWVNCSYIKIGYFETDSDLRYYDEIHGSLFVQAERVIELIYTKYLKADISYNGVTRIETYPFPKPAIREAIYNAIQSSGENDIILIAGKGHENYQIIGNKKTHFSDKETVEEIIKEN